MMLSGGLDIARSSLSVNADRASVVARNIAAADDPTATRKSINLVTTRDGGVRVASITRDFDAGLFRLVKSSTSDHASQAAIVAGLDGLRHVIGSPEDQASPASKIARLRDSLAQYASAPHEASGAASALGAARDVAQSLNSANDVVQRVRQQADNNIRDGVDRLNTLLAEFDDVNNEIIAGTRASRDITDHEDARTNILLQISEFIDVRTLPRSDNDMVVLTGSGLVLYEEIPRNVSFAPTQSYDAGVVGSPIYVDGIPVTGSSARQSANSGSLVGLANIRDNVAVTVQSQLDEMARGLITAFAESDQTGGGGSTQPGLFTYPGSPALPASGTIVAGLAGSISINATVDPSQGGDISLLRDGAISAPGNPAYIYNTQGAAGFSGRLNELVDAFDRTLAFDGTTGLSGSSSLISFSVQSTSWLEEQRRTEAGDEAHSAAVLERTSISLSKATGVNLDEEMTLMLDIERSYQASARLLSTLDAMLETLIAAAR